VGFALGGLLPTVDIAAQPEQQSIGVDMRDANRRLVGTATVRDSQDGIVITGFVRGLSPGSHGFHIHEVGLCEPPAFVSTGSHFNPTGKSHGLKNPAGPQSGDLPDLIVGPDGTGPINTIARAVSLQSGSSPLFNPRGAALVIHEHADDQLTQPEGNSGSIIACGLIASATPGAAQSTTIPPRDAAPAQNSAAGPPESANPKSIVTAALVGGFGLVLIGVGYALRRPRRGAP
jgi:Cu-Zn family superoxide dismutase